MNQKPLMLDHDQAEQLHHLLGIVEDWLLHCCEEALDDLGRFLTGLGWTGGPPERLVATLITELGEYSLALRHPTSPPPTRTGESA